MLKTVATSLWTGGCALLFPRRCLYCGRVVGFAEGCTACAGALEAARLSPEQRAELKKNTLCASVTQVTACWRYTYPVKNGVCRLKFSGKLKLAQPYGQQMAQVVQADFSDVAFDFAVPVPDSARSYKKRGYRVAGLLAESIATALAIPCRNDILLKEYETKTQHDLPRAQRTANVRGAYGVACPGAVEGKTILLADDILTTGATLEECARMLLLAGARAVYAVSFAAAQNPRST